MKALDYHHWRFFCQNSAKTIFGNMDWFHGPDYYVSRFTEGLERRISKYYDDDASNYFLYMSIGYYFGLKESYLVSMNDDRYYFEDHYENIYIDMRNLFAESIQNYLEIEDGDINNSLGNLKNNPTDESIVRHANLRKNFVLETTSKNYDLFSCGSEWIMYLWIWKLSTPEMRAKEIGRLQTLNRNVRPAELTLFLQSMDLSSDQLESNIKKFQVDSILEIANILEVSLYTNELEFSKIIFNWAFENVSSQKLIESNLGPMKAISVLCSLADYYSDIAEDNFEMYEKVVLHFMPHTLPKYGELLFCKGDYKKWVELQSLICDEPLYQCNNELKKIAKVQPEVLLPLYHQHISQLISQKKRQSYIEAVKLLKKLRAIYKKQKMDDQWERYIAFIEEKNKKLRAFQEELREGKIIEVKQD